MFIKSLRIADFRSIEETSATLEPLTIVRGLNHQGKSSIAQAIETALTGRNDTTDAQGRGANDNIRAGAKKAAIDLTLRTKQGDVAFGVTYGPNRTGRQRTSENPDSFIKWLEGNQDRLSCSVNSEYFVSQKAEDQKSILASLVLPNTYDFPADKRALAERYFGKDACDWKSNPLRIIDSLYDKAFEARKVSNAELKAIRIPELPAVRPSQSAASLRETLTELRRQAAVLAAAHSGGGEEIGRLKAQLEAAEQRLKDANADAEDVRSSLTDVDADVLTGPSLKTHEAIAAKRKVFNSLGDQAGEIARQIEDQNTFIQVLRDLLEDKKCPTCLQPIGEDFINAKVKEAQATISSMGAKQREVMQSQKALGDIGESERMLEAHRDASGKKTSYQRELADFVAKVSSEQESVRRLKQQIATAQQVEASKPADGHELRRTHTEIAELEAQLDPATRYETIQVENKAALERKDELARKLNALEDLVAYFGKDGVKAKLIKAHIEEFQQTANTVLKVWGYQAELSIEPYSFTVHNGKASLSLKQLSGSERLMFGVALQTAIAHHGKIKMVVIDKADTFLGDERKRLYSCLGQLIEGGYLEQAIVMVSDDRTDAPQRAGVVFYTAQAGKLVKL